MSPIGDAPDRDGAVGSTLRPYGRPELRQDLTGVKVCSPGRRPDQGAPEDGPQEVDMGRYVILLIAPVIIGFLIAAAVVAISGLRQRRLDARRALLEATDPALSPAHPAARTESSDITRRRIAS
jgi:hypothetical protein